MSVPPDVMRLMQGQQQQQPGMPGMPQQQQGGAPGAAGMSMPQKRKGDEAAAKVQVHIALNMLEQALPAYGSESKEGKVILKALNSLGDLFGKENQQDLVPAEIMKLVKGEPSMNGGAMQHQIQGGAQPGQPQQPGMQRPPMM